MNTGTTSLAQKYQDQISNPCFGVTQPSLVVGLGSRLAYLDITSSSSMYIQRVCIFARGNNAEMGFAALVGMVGAHGLPHTLDQLCCIS